MGQVGLDRQRAGVRRLGGPARRPHLRSRAHRGVGSGHSSVRPTGCGQRLSDAHRGRGLLLPRERALSADAAYRHLNLADRTADVSWPIPLDQATISDKDRTHPDLPHVVPAAPRRPLILGAGGQLGQALAEAFPGARLLTRRDVDLTDPEAVAGLDLSGVDTIINAAAFTAVDDAETPAGRSAAWAVNSTAVAALVGAARRHRCTVVHYSTDYVFDGAGGSGAGRAYRETDPVAPLSVYGQSKAAGESAVRTHPQHYLIRTSWVIGAGGNFVRTMHRLASQGVRPAVVGDQVGRLTFTDDLAEATRHLLEHGSPFGTYHLTSAGAPGTWADVARRVFAAAGRDPGDVRPVSTEEYGAGSERPVAPRPRLSVLDLSKIHDAGYSPPDQWARLEQVLSGLG